MSTTGGIVPELPHLHLPAEWTRETSPDGATTVLRAGGFTIVVERSLKGPLRESFPVAMHDVDVRITEADPGGEPGEVLSTLKDAVLDADPLCRRVIHAVLETDIRSIAQAESVGFRYVTDADSATGQTLALLVAEPVWITDQPADVHSMPR